MWPTCHKFDSLWINRASFKTMTSQLAEKLQIQVFQEFSILFIFCDLRIFQGAKIMNFWKQFFSGGFLAILHISLAFLNYGRATAQSAS